MRKLFLFLLLIILVSGLIFAGCSNPAPTPSSPAPAATKPAPAPTPTPAAAAPIELKFSYHTPAAASTTVKALIPWAKNVEEATKGKVKIIHYPAETLTKQNQSWEATVGGATDINWVVEGLFPGKFPLSEVAALPFLNLSSGNVGGRTQVGGEINSHIFMELYETFPEIQKEYADVKLLYVFASSSQFFITSKRPVSSLDTMKGVKIRALGGPSTEMVKALGGTPVLMTLPDVYEALDKGVLDGIENGWGGILTNKFYYPCKYWTDMSTTTALFAIIMNKDKWNSLSPDIQSAITSVSGMKGAETAGGGAWGGDEQQQVMNAVQKDKLTFDKISLAAGENQKWLDIAGKPIWDNWVAGTAAKGLPAQKVLDALKSLIEKYKTK